MAKERVYKKGAPGSEYDAYHAKPEQIANRAARNKIHNEIDPPKGKEIDHIKPLSKGGSSSKDNVRVVSEETNRKKADKMPKKGK